MMRAVPAQNPIPMPQPSPLQRPTWLPGYLPEFDGLRGLAILAVFFFHCHVQLAGTWISGFANWGWSGVTMFFFLSGFLVSSNLLAGRERAHYFHRFHARRALRIWPLYFGFLLPVFVATCWLVPVPFRMAPAAVPWLACVFFLQNLFPVPLPPSLGPTWALAIEEQFYFLWVPVVRWVRRPWMLAVLLAATFAVGPVSRHLHPAWSNPTHTLFHLDALALGSLLALGLYTLNWSRQSWLRIGILGLVAGMGAAFFLHDTPFLDCALAAGYGGAALTLAATSGMRTPIHWLLRHGPLAYYGKISYGFYMAHITVFICFTWLEVASEPYGLAGNLLVVFCRLAGSTLAAMALGRWVEQRFLAMKTRF